MLLKSLAVVLGIVALVSFSVQDEKKPQDPKSKPEAKPADTSAMQIPKAGPEHAILAEDVGLWDFTNEMYFEPGKPPMVMKGVVTNTLMPGGLWLFSDWKANDNSFYGHSVVGWDGVKKRYRGTWVDSWTATPYAVDGQYNAEKKQMVSTVAGQDATGADSVMTETVTYTSAKERKIEFKMDIPGVGPTVIMKSSMTKR